MHLETRLGKLSVLLSAMLLGIFVLWMAWPRLQASLRFLPVEQAIDRYYATQEIPSNRMLTLMGFAREAIGIHDHYRYHDGLSFLYYLRGLDIYTPALERRDAYRMAEQTAIESVVRAPAQPEVWMRIATVRAVLREEPEDVIEPWKMSVYTGRTHSTLLVPRAGVVLPYLEFMDAEARSMLRDQVMLAWELRSRHLMAELRRRDPRLEGLRELLSETAPALLLEMEARFEKTR